jgi:UDP-arabinose 4-epimerase
MRTVLVTGGAGYVGSHCCKALAQAGFAPVVLDNLATGHADLVRWGDLVEGDATDAALLARTIAETSPVAVVHLAARSLVSESMRRPDLYWETNVVGTLALLRAMRDAGVRRLVFSSSAAVYGEPASMPIAEGDRKDPINPYGASKLACEHMMDGLDAAYGVTSVRLRYFNAAGADPDGQIGEDHDPETHLIPLVLDAALGRREAVQIFGTDYPTPDGTAIRDYVHVADLADAHVKALEHLLAGGATQALNLGRGHGASVREVVAAAEQVVGRPIPQVVAPRRAGDPPVLTADPTRARELLGWQPRYPGLPEMVAHAWAWHRQRFGH